MIDAPMKSPTSPRCEARKPTSVSMPRDTKNSAANTSRTGITSERARRPAQSDSLSTSPATNAPSGADSPPHDVSAAAPSAAAITVTTNDSPRSYQRHALQQPGEAERTDEPHARKDGRCLRGADRQLRGQRFALSSQRCDDGHHRHEREVLHQQHPRRHASVKRTQFSPVVQRLERKPWCCSARAPGPR